jgi:glycosyltransferase involved in cell wall biosynthesis
VDRRHWITNSSLLRQNSLRARWLRRETWSDRCTSLQQSSVEFTAYQWNSFGEQPLERPFISIVIPAYNESARIGNALDEVLRCVHERDWHAEILVVNDGSTDRTAAIVQEFASLHPEVRLLNNPGKSGQRVQRAPRGAARRRRDRDVHRCRSVGAYGRSRAAVRSAAQGADIAIGSRWLERKRQTLKQPLYRQFFGRCFNAITRLVMGLPFADTQCGFKAFRRPWRRRSSNCNASSAGALTLSCCLSR